MELKHGEKLGAFSGNSLSFSSLLRGLSPEARQSLQDLTEIKEYLKEDAVFSSGGQPSGVYILKKGEAVLSSRGSQGFQRIAGPDEVFGLTESISNQPYQSSLKCITPCTFEFISARSFLDFLAGEPEACFRLAKSLSMNIQKDSKNHYSPII